jgi:hypothetical protein
MSTQALSKKQRKVAEYGFALNTKSIEDPEIFVVFDSAV